MNESEYAFKYIYPKVYKGPKPISKQVEILKSSFPEISNSTYDEAIATRPLPEGAEGYFAIPRWRALMTGLTYRPRIRGEAIEKVITMIGLKRKFLNKLAGEVGADHVRPRRKSVRMFHALEYQQKGHDILIVPAQFGLAHQGRQSLFLDFTQYFRENEFGLGIFEVACMLLTHPKRLMSCRQLLWVYCAGDGFAHGVGDQFRDLPFFCYSGGGVGLGVDWFSSNSEYCGAASAFLP